MINYDLKKIRLIAFDVDGVLSASQISMAVDGTPLRTVNIKDGYAIQLAQKMGLRIAIITGGRTENIRRRYLSLGLNAEDIHIGAAVKIEVYERYVSANGFDDAEVMYVGDDIPDYEVMRRVGCPCCPKDACPDVKDISVYISPYNGGYGCARDVIEQVLRAKGLWLNNEKAFGW